jgi:GDP-D-mannose 3',5'-epimerase
MKIVVTGGAGMIGSNLCARLVKDGHNVTVIDNLWRGTIENLTDRCGEDFEKINFINADLSVLGNWIEALRDVDCVYHLADIVAGIGFVFSNESEIFRKNLTINASVGTASELMKVKRFVYVGTACSFPLELQYGVNAPPMREEQQFPAHPESAYGWSKLMGELDATYMQKYSGIPTVILVLHNVYGSPCEYMGKRSQALPAMSYRALLANKSNGILSVWGNGSQGRAFVHVNDVVTALTVALEKGAGVGPIQIGPNVCTSIRDAANIIKNIINPKIRLEFDETKPTGDLGRSADYTKAKLTLGWTPRMLFEDGLKDMINWINSKEKFD